MSSFQIRPLSKNSILFAFYKDSRWLAALLSYENIMAFCDPLEKKIHLGVTEFKTTKIHQSKWLEAIRQGQAFPDLESYPSVTSTTQEMTDLFEQHLGLHKTPQQSAEGLSSVVVSTGETGTVDA